MCEINIYAITALPRESNSTNVCIRHMGNGQVFTIYYYNRESRYMLCINLLWARHNQTDFQYFQKTTFIWGKMLYPIYHCYAKIKDGHAINHKLSMTFIYNLTCFWLMLETRTHIENFSVESVNYCCCSRFRRIPSFRLSYFLLE